MRKAGNFEENIFKICLNMRELRGSLDWFMAD